MAGQKLDQIRAARLDDLEAIVAIYNAAVASRTATADLEPVTVAARRDWFERHSATRHPLWVLEREGAIEAWLSLGAYHSRPGYAATAELAVYVAPGRRRRGHATRLLGHAIAQAPAVGIETLLAIVFAHNEPSVALFERHGFERWGRLPRVVRLDARDADVLILGLRVAP